MTLQKLPEIDQISSEVFLKEIVPAGQPIVIRGAVNHWEVVAKAANTRDLCDYIQAGAGPDNVSVMRAKPSVGGRFFYADDMREFNFEHSKMRFSAFVDRLLAGAEGDALYMGSTLVGQGFPSLSDAFDMPLVPTARSRACGLVIGPWCRHIMMAIAILPVLSPGRERSPCLHRTRSAICTPVR